jgi:HlyD family secretion protein
VRPRATEVNLLAAERAVEQARLGEESVQEYVEQKHLAALFTRFMLGSRNLERMEKAAALARQQAEEQLKLLKQGAVEIDDRRLDYVLRAPVAGHVLEIGPREGAPVVPSSSYGSGSVVVTLADMDHMVFRGTVDETDVGRLAAGMTAAVRVGALPGVEVAGTVAELALKARERNNAVVFDIRIDLTAPESVRLRSGFSAVAEIEIDRRDDVLTLPERVVVFRGDEAFVDVLDAAGSRVEKGIETGLSDGLTVEVASGLTEGDVVLERRYE